MFPLKSQLRAVVACSLWAQHDRMILELVDVMMPVIVSSAQCSTWK